MDLDALLRQVETDSDLERCTTEQYRRVARKFGEYLGEIATTEHLTVATVNAFLASLKDKGLTGVTVRNYRAAMTKIWNAAVLLELTAPYDARRLRSPKILRRPVKAWTLSQVKILIDAAALLTDRLQCGVAMCDLVAAWVRVQYDSGFRSGDMRLLRWSDVDLAGRTAIITQHKTHVPHTAPLSVQSIQFLARIELPPRPLVFPLTKGGMRRLELLLYRMALSLGFRRMRGQGLGTLRKTHATQIYERDGESAAAESLGHVGGTRTVRASYIDSRSIRSGRLPPEPAA